MLANAVRICEASYGVLFRREDDAVQAEAMLGVPPAFMEFWQRGLQQPGSKSALGRVIESRQTVHIADVTLDPAYIEGEPIFVAAVNLGKFRTILTVPMLQNNGVVGVFAIYRQEVRPFTDKHIDLVKNFAAQAVIAVENARLLNELRQRTDDLTESLEQQTATSEVLKVISSSPGDLEPVFQAMLENATRICEAQFGTMYRYDGSFFNVTAMHNAPPAFEAARRRAPFRPPEGSALATAAATKQVAHIQDIRAHSSFVVDTQYNRDGIKAGYRTIMSVPMLKNNEVIGVMSIFRPVVRPFTDKQIELVQTFAAQAVIAIENTRLLSELRESLQQQTATADVLKVISSSPGDLGPVFETLLENAVRLCEAKFGTMARFDGELFHPVAELNTPPALTDFLRRRGPFRPRPGALLDQLRQTKAVAHIADEAAHPSRGSPAELGGARSRLCVPMLNDNELVGAIIIYRQEVRPFTDKQIELVQNFAAQAVIAIENTRLLNELRQRTDDLTESLQQQTATSEVLRVISSSAGELEPVFSAMLENAMRLCEARFGTLVLREGDAFRTVALHNAPPEYMELRKREP